MIVTGALVIYHGKAAAVSAITGDKLEIRIEGGESKRVRPKDVEFLHRGPANVLPPPAPATIPDWQELAELLDGENTPFNEFTALAYGADSAANAFAVYQELQHNFYFTGSIIGGVTVRPEEERRKLADTAAAKTAAQAKREALLERIRTAAILPEDLSSLREVENVALARASSSRLLKDLGIEAAPVPAHQLLNLLGIWQDSFDPWPERLGVDIAVPSAPLATEEDFSSEVIDMTGYPPAYAIDDEGSNDPDDAIAFRDGLLWVHIADPAAAVLDGSAAETEAKNRGESSYLPELLSPMLPPESVSRFGLGLNPVSNALSFAVSIDGNGEAELQKMHLSRVRVERLTYSGAAAMMEDPEFSAMQEALGRFKSRRAEAGACFIRLPEVKISLDESGKVNITPSAVSPERELVANAMIAAGHAVAKFMAAQDIPFPFAQQQPPEEILPQDTDSMASMFAIRRNMNAGTVDTRPGLHFGLGISPYARVTSPLRRYTDLLAHYQIRRFLAGAAPLSGEEIDKRLAICEPAAAERRKLEKYAREYFTCLYFKQHPQWQGKGIVVDHQDSRYTIMIPELAYEYKCRLQFNLKIDSEVELSLTKADPVALTVRMNVKKV